MLGNISFIGVQGYDQTMKPDYSQINPLPVNDQVVLVPPGHNTGIFLNAQA